MDRLLIVDGSNLLFQMFYGMPARIVAVDGHPVQGTLGFIGALLKVIRKTNPSHIVVLFDGENDNPRKALDEKYKANREDYSQMEEDETPFGQLSDICDGLQLLNIPYYETEHMEADDLIASYALQHNRQGGESIILSQDSDFFQLVSEHTHVFRYRGERSSLITPEYIREKFNISPRQYADFKSLVGDGSDNIKGIPRIGPKTAAKLLNQYNDIDGLLRSLEDVTPVYVKESLSGNRQRLIKNSRLITLEGEEKLPISISSLVWKDAGLSVRSIMEELSLFAKKVKQ